MTDLAPIAGFPNYFVSTKGAVFSTSSGAMKERAQGIKPGGYRFVGLYAGGKVTYRMIHRLVADAFLPNPNSLPEVNHLDGNKANNTLENLEWCGRLENVRHADRNGLLPRGVTHGAALLSEGAVREIRASAETCLVLGERYGVCPQVISNVKRRRSYRNV